MQSEKSITSATSHLGRPSDSQTSKLIELPLTRSELLASHREKGAKPARRDRLHQRANTSFDELSKESNLVESCLVASTSIMSAPRRRE